MRRKQKHRKHAEKEKLMNFQPANENGTEMLLVDERAQEFGKFERDDECVVNIKRLKKFLQ